MEEITLLHRQVHPTHIQNENVSQKVFESLSYEDFTSLTFTPRESDKNMLSVYNGQKFTAEQAYLHYIALLKSAGVLSLSLKECVNCDVTYVLDDNPFDGHASINFAERNKKECKAIAKELKRIAVKRGWTFLPK